MTPESRSFTDDDADPQDPLVETTAQRVVELLRDRGLLGPLADPRDTASLLLTASEIAARYRVHRSWVYANARRLGAVRLGSGPKAALRFDPDTVAGAIAAMGPRTIQRPVPTPSPAKPDAKARRRHGGLLPIQER